MVAEDPGDEQDDEENEDDFYDDEDDDESDRSRVGVHDEDQGIPVVHVRRPSSSGSSD